MSQQLPTLADVARACGVSVATASKALSPHAERQDVGRDTAERVRRAARELGYDRDKMANLRARRRWGNIGLLWGRRAPRSEGAYETLLTTTADLLDQRGLHLLFTPVQDLAGWRRMQMTQRLDGVLVVEIAPEAVLHELEIRGYPAVLINCASSSNVRQVLADDNAGAQQLVAHLAQVGCRRLVYATLPRVTGHVSEADRQRGIQEAAAQFGLPVQEISGEDSAGIVAACRGRSRAGLIVYDFQRVPTLLQALREAGLRVPHQVALAACTDVSWFAHLSPLVTAWQVPMPAMVAAAVERLCAQLEGKPITGDEPLRVPGTLVVRQSTMVS